MRRLLAVVHLSLLGSRAVAGPVPGVDGESSDSGLPGVFEWRYEGVALALYVGVFVLAYFLPEKWRPVIVPLALLWPILFWVVIAIRA